MVEEAMEAAVTQAVATVLEARMAGWAEVAVLAAACLAVQALGAKEDGRWQHRQR
jgi:hypothetical protein